MNRVDPDVTPLVLGSSVSNSDEALWTTKQGNTPGSTLSNLPNSHADDVGPHPAPRLINPRNCTLTPNEHHSTGFHNASCKFQ